MNLKSGVAVATIGGLLAWWGVASHRETEQQRAIVDAVRPLLGACQSRQSSARILIRGKVLVWDMRSNSLSRAQQQLPSELRARSTDPQITVVMVLGARDVQVGTYSISRQPGYRQYVDVCVAYWPQKEAVGAASIVSREPASVRPVASRPEYGDISEPIAQWIAGLSRAGE